MHFSKIGDTMIKNQNDRISLPAHLNALPTVKHTKGTAFMDDDLESDAQKHPLTACLMKSAVTEILKEINLKTDIRDDLPLKETRYVG